MTERIPNDPSVAPPSLADTTARVAGRIPRTLRSS
jgi:hypothetical protein